MARSWLRPIIDNRLSDLGEPPLARLVDEGRAAGMSWRDLSRDVHARTGVAVSDVTLINWFA